MASQCAYSPLWKMYFAFGKVGTQRPLRSMVFQPVWSMCRCVQKTCVMSSKVRSAARKLSSHGCLGKSIGGGGTLSSPVQGSISTGCFRVGTAKGWEVVDLFPEAGSKTNRCQTGREPVSPDGGL